MATGLGEEVYGKMSGGLGAGWAADPDLGDYQRRIDGVQAELRQLERALEEAMAQRGGRQLDADVRVEGYGPAGEPGTDIGQGT